MVDVGGGEVQIAWEEGGGGSGRNLCCRVGMQRMLREPGGEMHQEMGSAPRQQEHTEEDMAARQHWGTAMMMGLVTHSSSVSVPAKAIPPLMALSQLCSAACGEKETSF